MAKISFKKAISFLINKEIKRSELAKSLLFSQKKKTYPCITVSRETGSGGRLIAKLVAKKLKMKFYNKEFVNLISQSAKKRKGIVETLDEKSRSMIEGIIDSLQPLKDKFSEGRYFRHLCQTILSLTEKGRTVILGRGANFIIPSEKALKIRIVAPFKTRIENTVKYEKKSLSRAKNYIRRIHNQRKEFVKRYFRKNISNANYYDLVINTRHLKLNQAVSLIIQAFKEKFPKA